jgi:alpha-N-arabinofuranosidase
MFAAHQNGESLRTLVSAPYSNYSRNGKPATLRGLSTSASRKGNQVTITITNPDHAQTRETEIALRGATVKEVKVTVLAANDVKAHNSFANPNAVAPKEGRATLRNDGTVTYNAAPASVTRLQITLT